jgi:hypothetical protein
MSWQKISKQKEDQEKDGEMALKYLATTWLTINGATRHTRTRILNKPRHQISRVQQPLPSPVTEGRNDDDN